MRVKYCVHTDSRSAKIVSEYLSVLQKNIQLENGHPEIIHLIGSWSPVMYKEQKKGEKMGLPVVYSPFSSLNVWHMLRFPRLNGISVIAMSRTEMECLKQLGYDNQLCEIRNAVVTNSITCDEMVQKTQEVYQSAILKNEETIDSQLQHMVKETITYDGKWPTEETILFHFLKTQDRIRRKDIPISYLHHIHQLLYSDNYNEDVLVNGMKALDIIPFCSSLLHVMKTETGITEGFMPVPDSNDALANKIKSLLTRY